VTTASVTVVGQGSDPVLPEAAAALVSTIPVALVRSSAMGGNPLRARAGLTSAWITSMRTASWGWLPRRTVRWNRAPS